MDTISWSFLLRFMVWSTEFQQSKCLSCLNGSICLKPCLSPSIKKELKNVQATILNFIWAPKRHRIPKSVLFATKFKYYWAAPLRRIPAWTSMFAYSKWIEVEKLWIALIHPNSLLWSTSQVRVYVFLLRPMLLTREVWRSSSSKFGLSPVSSSMTSFLFQPLIPEWLEGQNLRPWFDNFSDFRIWWILKLEESSLLSRSKPNLICQTDVSTLICKSVTLCVRSIALDDKCAYYCFKYYNILFCIDVHLKSDICCT